MCQWGRSEYQPCRNRVNARVVPESLHFVSRQSGTSSRRALMGGENRVNRLFAEAQAAASIVGIGARKRGLPGPEEQVKFNFGG